jgi:hypothetical protein
MREKSDSYERLVYDRELRVVNQGALRNALSPARKAGADTH